MQIRSLPSPLLLPCVHTGASQVESVSQSIVNGKEEDNVLFMELLAPSLPYTCKNNFV